MSRVLLLLSLLIGALAFNILVNSDNDDKVKVDFYYESLCPYCQQFMKGALKTAANTKVKPISQRISGRFAISLSLPMATQNGLGTVLPGASPVSME